MLLNIVLVCSSVTSVRCECEWKMVSKQQKGQTVHSEAKEVIRRVINKCNKEARTVYIQNLLKQSSLWV